MKRFIFLTALLAFQITIYAQRTIESQIEKAKNKNDLIPILYNYCNSTDPISITVLQQIISPLIPANDLVQLFLYDNAEDLFLLVSYDIRKKQGYLDRHEAQKIFNRITKGTGNLFFQHTPSNALLANQLPDSMRGHFIKAVLLNQINNAISIAGNLSIVENNVEWIQMIDRLQRINSQNYNTSFNIDKSLKNVLIQPIIIKQINSNILFEISYQSVQKTDIQEQPTKMPTVQISEPSVQEQLTKMSTVQISEPSIKTQPTKIEYDITIDNYFIDKIWGELGYTNLNANKLQEPVKSLPQFFLATQLFTTLQTNKNETDIILTSQLPVVCIRLIDAKPQTIINICNIIKSETKKKFIIIVNSDVFVKPVGEILNHENVIAIILGHYNVNMDDSLLAEKVTQILNQLSFVKRVSNKPVLLACSYIDNKGVISQKWTNMFANDINKFDGFAVYNINRFQTFEFINREKVCADIGVPKNKPTIILDFVGTIGNNEDVQESWERKLNPFLQRIINEGWAGIIFFSNNKEDFFFKDKLLSQINLNNYSNK